MNDISNQIMMADAAAPGVAADVILPSLNETMNVDLVVNPNFDAWILHDKPFPIALMWAEYDIDTSSLILVGRDGKIIDLGMKIFPDTRKFLRNARQICTLRIQNDDIDDSYVLPLLVRETGQYKA